MANVNKDSLNIIDQFILILENIPKYKNCFNPFNSDNDKKDILRKNNLRLYLGIPFSGVPLSSENIIINNDHFLYGTSKGYCRISECETPVYEKNSKYYMEHSFKL